MITGIIIIWLLCGVLAFLVLCRDEAATFGRLTRGDVAFFGAISAFGGPIALFIAAAVAFEPGEFWSKQVWPR